MPRRRRAIGSFEDEVRRTLAEDRFVGDHPEAARSLDEAFELLWTGKDDHDVVTRVGDHLRDALLSSINDLLGPAPGEDRPILRLREHLDTLDMATREAKVAGVVVELARVALRLDHRFSTIREEVQQGEPDVGPDEMRRAAFATALACYELDRLATR